MFPLLLQLNSIFHIITSLLIHLWTNCTRLRSMDMVHAKFQSSNLVDLFFFFWCLLQFLISILLVVSRILKHQVLNSLLIFVFVELFIKVFYPSLFMVSYVLNWFVRGSVGLKLKQAQAPHLMKPYCLTLLNIIGPPRVLE